MNRFIRNEQYRVPFKFCQECKKFIPYESGRCCLKDDGCREAVRLYRKYESRGKEIEVEQECERCQ